MCLIGILMALMEREKSVRTGPLISNAYTCVCDPGTWSSCGCIYDWRSCISEHFSIRCQTDTSASNKR